MKRVLLRLAAAALIALSAGCTHTVRHGADTLFIVQEREPISLNPALENGFSSGQFGAMLFSYLLKIDDHDRLIPDAALRVPTRENGDISADGKTIVFHLRPGLRFSDGTPLTARDCVYSIEAVQNKANNVQSRYGYDRVLKAQARDDRTLVLHLNEPFAPILNFVLGPQGFPILPEHVLRGTDFNHGTFNEKPVGSGPYIVVQWHRGDKIVFEANPYFSPAPRIKHIRLRFTADSNAAINQLRTGEADAFINDENVADYPIVAGISSITAMRAPLDAVGALIFNTSGPFTSDAGVRRALSAAIDVPSLVRKTFRGAVSAQDAGRGLFTWAYSPHAYPDATYDPALARKLLDDAGWRLGSDGVRHKDGAALALRLVMQAHTGGDEEVGAAIRQYERAAGVDVELKSFPVTELAAPADLGGPVYGGKFDLALYPFTNGDDPDVTDQFSCAAVPPNGYNKSRYCSRSLDQEMAAARRPYDRQQRRVVYERIQARLHDEMPILLFYQRRQINGITNRLHNVTVSPSQQGPYWNVAAWTLDP